MPKEPCLPPPQDPHTRIGYAGYSLCLRIALFLMCRAVKIDVASCFPAPGEIGYQIFRIVVVDDGIWNICSAHSTFVESAAEFHVLINVRKRGVEAPNVKKNRSSD